MGGRSHSGAGIVPCCFIDGEPHFLLGREREIRDWVGSLRWSGLEGSSKGAESTVANALREAFEESAGLLFESQQERDGVGQEMISGKFHLKITVESDSKAHVTYVKMLRLPDDIEELFLETRAYLASYTRRKRFITMETNGWKSVQKNGTDHPPPPNKYCTNHPGLRTIIRRSGLSERIVNEDYLEKIRLTWISLTQLSNAVQGKHGHGTIVLRPLFAVVANAIVNHFKDHPAAHQ